MRRTIPAVMPPLPRDRRLDRRYAPSVALQWLAAGWRDLVAQPGVSLLYGLGVFLVSAAVVGGLVVLGLDYILFPALAGFMIIAPFLAIGLYEKSRAIEEGRPVSLRTMLLVRPRRLAPHLQEHRYFLGAPTAAS